MEVRVAIGRKLGWPCGVNPTRLDKRHFLGFADVNSKGFADVDSKRVFLKIAPIPSDNSHPQWTKFAEACGREIEINEILKERFPNRIPRPDVVGHGIEDKWIWIATRAVDGHSANLHRTAENLQRYSDVYQKVHEVLRTLERKEVPPRLLTSQSEFLVSFLGEEIPSWKLIFGYRPSERLLPGWALDNKELLTSLDERYRQMLISPEDGKKQLMNPDLSAANVVLGASREDDVAVDWAYLSWGRPDVAFVRFLCEAFVDLPRDDAEACLNDAPLVSAMDSDDVDAAIAASASLYYCRAFGLLRGCSFSPPEQTVSRRSAPYFIDLLEHRNSQRRSCLSASSSTRASGIPFTRAGYLPNPARNGHKVRWRH